MANFKPGDRIQSNGNDFIAQTKGARWVAVVEKVNDLGAGLVTLSTVGFWFTPGKPPPTRPTRRNVALDTIAPL